MPANPVNALAFPLLATSMRAVPRAQVFAAPFDRRRGRFGSGEHARDLGAGGENGQKTSLRPR